MAFNISGLGPSEATYEKSNPWIKAANDIADLQKKKTENQYLEPGLQSALANSIALQQINQAKAQYAPQTEAANYGIKQNELNYAPQTSRAAIQAKLAEAAFQRAGANLKNVEAANLPEKYKAEAVHKYGQAEYERARAQEQLAQAGKIRAYIKEPERYSTKQNEEIVRTTAGIFVYDKATQQTRPLTYQEKQLIGEGAGSIPSRNLNAQTRAMSNTNVMQALNLPENKPIMLNAFSNILGALTGEQQGVTTPPGSPVNGGQQQQPALSQESQRKLSDTLSSQIEMKTTTKKLQTAREAAMRFNEEYSYGLSQIGDASKFMGPLNRVRNLKGEQLRSALSTSDDPALQNFYRFAYQTAPTVAADARQQMGGQATDNERKIMDSMSNPEWVVQNPQQAINFYKGLQPLISRNERALLKNQGQVKQSLTDSVKRGTPVNLIPNQYGTVMMKDPKTGQTHYMRLEEAQKAMQDDSFNLLPAAESME